MLNAVFFFLIIAGTLTAAFTGKMQAVTDATVDNAKSAVELALSLVGQMALWLGVMRIVEDAGYLRALTRVVAPVMRRLFPSIPADHPALGAMTLNIAANMMGLTNAATPFGIKAMLELNKLNTRPGVATNAMALFLAINTSGVAVLPTGVIALRAAAGADNATGIFFPSILATAASTIMGILVCKLIERLPIFAAERYPSDERSQQESAGIVSDVRGLAEAELKLGDARPFSIGRLVVAGAIMALLVYALTGDLALETAKDGFLGAVRTVSGAWILPLILVTLVLAGFSKRVKVYESLVAGAKEAFGVATMIIPFLVAILVAIGIFRASGAMDQLVATLGPVTSLIGVPAEVLPMAIIRPLSGSGALAVLVETLKTHGPNSLFGFMASVMSGSTETTFYVLAVYFGAVRVRATRHTVIPCLAADVTGLYLAVQLARWFYA